MTNNEKEGFRYWRMFLRYSDDYKKCCALSGEGELALLYSFFGDVFVVEFDEWWDEKKYNIENEIEPKFVLDVVSNIKEFSDAYDEDSEYLLAVVINLHTPIKNILKNLEKELRRRNVEARESLRNYGNDDFLLMPRYKRGRPPADSSLYHNFGIRRKITRQDFESMDVMLKILWESENSSDPQGEIGIRIGIGKPLSGNKLEESEEKRKIGMLVSRYLSKAKKIIKCAEKGEFPSQGESC